METQLSVGWLIAWLGGLFLTILATYLFVLCNLNTTGTIKTVIYVIACIIFTAIYIRPTIQRIKQE